MPLRAPKGFIAENDAKVSQVGHPAPPWMSCYADLMTELVCFFVILYALSAALNKDVQKAASDVQEMIDKKEVSGQVKIDKEGLKITLQEQGNVPFFSSGSSDTTPEIDEMIMKLAPTLRKLSDKNDIIVEGHTDAQPVRGALSQYYDSNWELSTARATSVARLIVDKYGVPANRVGAIGYGEHRPVASNDTPEGRSRNRRVVFFVKSLPPEPDKGEKPKVQHASHAPPEEHAPAHAPETAPALEGNAPPNAPEDGGPPPAAAH